MVINTNLSAQWATTRLQNSSGALAQSLQRLSSGSKITSPADDSAGLAVSIKLGSQLARINAASNNIGNAMSFMQTQDGYLAKVSDALTRMNELGVLSQDITKTDGDRALYEQEFVSLAQGIQSLATKDFNGVRLFSASPLNVTVDGEANKFIVQGVDLQSVSYATVLTDHIDVIGNGGTGAVYAVNDLKKVLNQLAKDRAALGANLETLTYHQSELDALKNNLSAANSRITDVDVAQESTNYARQNILVQSGTAMLAQANSQPQAVLKLLGG
jgi:flagellin